MTTTNRAVVIGGSLAGLLAARALRDHVDEVVLVDRDTFPAGAEPRKGVPQARHLHLLLVRGAQILDELLPGLTGELAAAGAVAVEWPGDMLWQAPAGWSSRFGGSVSLLSCRRELLESCVRRRVFADERLQVLEATDVTGLLANPDQSAVTGVQLRDRNDGAHRSLEARLVVDASGRDSNTPEWLAEIGYAPPRATVINSFLGYASRIYARPDDLDTDWKALFLQPRAPHTTRGAGLFPIDGDRWHVTLAGAGRDYPPTDEAGFLAFAKGLRAPILFEAIKDARPLTPISGYRRTESQLRHYDELERWPDQFVVLGDALCAFNPIYGQGMSVAAEAALALDRWLRAATSTRDLQRTLARTVAIPWLLATGEDFRYPTTEGGRPGPIVKLTHRYLDRVVAVATVDEVVLDAFVSVVHLVRPPSTLFKPGILARVLRGPRRPLLTAPPTSTP
jgi:2-polyprenyl-6-methoxyphenol hydroxylase-like FAD-dependent oxidoreductase